MSEAAPLAAGAARRRPTGRRARPWLILALGLMLAGCSFVSTRIQPYLGGPAFPPTDPAHVEILRSEPVRPLYRLGEVFVEPSGRVVVGLAIRYSGS